MAQQRFPVASVEIPEEPAVPQEVTPRLTDKEVLF